MKKLYVLRKQLGMTQKQLATILSIGQNAYSMIENEKCSLTERNRLILRDKLNVNPDWLTGSSKDMFITNDTHIEPIAPLQGGTTGVPYYSKPATDTEIAPDYYIDFLPFNGCSFYRTVFGDSMYPRYSAGDIIACKKITSKETIMYGEAYFCIISSDNDVYETVKVLRKHTDPEYIILKPINPKYDETVIPLSNLRELYIIKGKIEQNF